MKMQGGAIHRCRLNYLTNVMPIVLSNVFFLKRRHCGEVFKVAGERKHFVRHLREKKRRENKQPSVYLMSKGVSFKTLRFMCWVSNSKEFLGY